MLLSFSSPSGSIQRKGKHAYTPIAGPSNNNHPTNIHVFNLTSPEGNHQVSILDSTAVDFVRFFIGHTAWERTEREDALHWLSPLEFYTKHADIIQRRTEDTGTWLLENPLFEEWANRSSSQGTLLCTGRRESHPLLSVYKSPFMSFPLTSIL